ncbi:hypothetical protein BST28_11115 [Mycolicibacter kumamotonensis]|uniref:Uncharacterized protein n=1 Tax=Mycolicibacter kumamotonensis TaxID=354243 RepID=A0A1X0E4T3_9MYCO|nr:hypothetical protein BST28_11115 [Mycolicibacter kumamotonensis]
MLLGVEQALLSDPKTLQHVFGGTAVVSRSKLSAVVLHVRGLTALDVSLVRPIRLACGWFAR